MPSSVLSQSSVRVGLVAVSSMVSFHPLILFLRFSTVTSNVVAQFSCYSSTNNLRIPLVGFDVVVDLATAQQTTRSKADKTPNLVC